jgi:hypothetical protein
MMPSSGPHVLLRMSISTYSASSYRRYFMKWFKHQTDCITSEGLSVLIEKAGFAGYGRWFRILEIVAARMDKTDKCSVEYPISKWCAILSTKPNHLAWFLELTEMCLHTKIEVNGNMVRITIPNLLEIRDEYTSKSGQCRDNVPSVSGQTPLRQRYISTHK